MSLTKIITDTIDLNLDTTGLKMPKGTTTQRPDGIEIDYLIVAGGGGGAGTANNGNGAGGGGAGGLLTGFTKVDGASGTQTFDIEVGLGGAGGANTTLPNYDGNPGVSGSNSIFSSFTAIGGGGGGNRNPGGANGANGGSGGGSGCYGGGANSLPGNGTSGQGNDGGTGEAVGVYVNFYGGGGGGANAAGSASAGGNGVTSSLITTSMATTYSVGEIDSSNVYFAGGGGGGRYTSGSGTGTGGLGGGGTGGTSSDNKTAGTDGTGGGGGGASWPPTASPTGYSGADGGNGVIILSTNEASAVVTAGVTVNGTAGAGTRSGLVNDDKYVYIITVATAGDTISFTQSPGDVPDTIPVVGTMRENTTTSKMEIYTGAKGWRSLQQTGQDVGIVPSDNFNVTQYVGDGGSIKTLTGLNFQPDLTWVKITTQTWLGTVWDSVEGVGLTKEFCLFSAGANTAGARGAGNSATYGGLTSFNNDGWTSGPGSTDNGNTNSSTNTFVTYNWKVGGNSNTYNKNGTGYASAADAGMDVGNITPTGSSVNTENGISIIQWTGIDTVGKTIPHGFSSAPDVVITKANTAGYGWVTFTNLFSQNTTTDYLYLNDVAAIAGASFGGTNYCTFNPTTLEVAATGGNWSYGVEQTAYCFKSTPGFSLIGRYTGTGSATNTPIIYTGFKPAWILIKNCNNNGNSWVVMDIARNTTSPFSNYLLPDYANGTYTSAGDVVNYYDNGFQIAGTANFFNQAGNDFFFMCFAS